MLRDFGGAIHAERVGFLDFGRGEPVFVDSGQPAGNSMGELPAALVLGRFHALSHCHRIAGLNPPA